MGGKSCFCADAKCGFSQPQHCEVFYGSVTLRMSLQNEIMAYLHFSELNSIQWQYHLFYMILLLKIMLFGPWAKPRKYRIFLLMQFFND